MADVKKKMDLKTAEYIVDKARNDRSVFPVEFCECEKCGADYIEELGHDCDNVVELTWHTKDETDSIAVEDSSTVVEESTTIVEGKVEG